jgi:hypothetical protein
MKTSLLFALCLALVASSVSAQDAKPDAALQKKIDALIQQLGDAQWQKRNAATNELLRIGKPALKQLDAALKHADEEVRHRAATLLAAINGQGKDAKPAGATLKEVLTPLLGNEGGTVVLDGNGLITIMAGGDGGLITVEASGEITIMGGDDGIINVDKTGENIQVTGGNARTAIATVAKVRQAIAQLLANPSVAKMNAGGLGGVITAQQDGAVTIVDHAEGRIQQLNAQGAVVEQIQPQAAQEDAMIIQGDGVIIINGQIVQGGFGAPVPAQNLPPGETVAADMLDSFGAKLAEAEGGLRCTDVKAGTLADKMGMQVGDLVTKVSGRDAAKFEDVKDLLLKPDPANPLKVEVSRKGQSITLTAPKP